MQQCNKTCLFYSSSCHLSIAVPIERSINVLSFFCIAALFRTAFNKGTEGKIVDVLVERVGGRDGQMAGRSPYMQAVNFIGSPDQIGQIVACCLSEARQNSMTGDIVNLKGAA